MLVRAFEPSGKELKGRNLVFKSDPAAAPAFAFAHTDPIGSWRFEVIDCTTSLASRFRLELQEPVAKPCEACGRISVKCAKREDVFRFRKVHFAEMHPR